MTTPAQSAIDLMVSFAAEQPALTEALPVCRELGMILDADGTLDGLDAHDARHAIAVIMADLLLIPDGDDDDPTGRLARRADWIASGAGSGPLHDPPAVVAALRRTCALVGRQ